MYIFGGFSSVLLNDILVYKPPNCKAFRNEEVCKNAGPGIKCIWNKNYCESWESGNMNNILRAKCPPKTGKSCFFFSLYLAQTSSWLEVEMHSTHKNYLSSFQKLKIHNPLIRILVFERGSN